MKAKNLLKDEIALFEKNFSDALKSNNPLLDIIMKYITDKKGKQLRPLFVLLSAKINGKINDSTYRAASLVELLHTASLVHDDVVDDAYRRRSAFSINALWKNKIAVLVGDYLLAKGLLLSLDHKDHETLAIMSNAVREMSEGELLQIEKARKLDITESVYFEIIKAKTASLIACACAAGAYSVSNDETIKNDFKLIGENIGIAFQIKDDLFDYGKADVGKPTGNDIKEKKMTLPLIYTLNNIPTKNKNEIINIVKNNNNDKRKVKQVIDTVIKCGGIEYAEKVMQDYVDKAIDQLNKYPQNEASEALKEIIYFTIGRKY